MFIRISLVLIILPAGTITYAQTAAPPPKTLSAAQSLKPALRPVGPPPTQIVATTADAFSILVRWDRAIGSAGSAVYLSTSADTGFRRIWLDSIASVATNAYSSIGSTPTRSRAPGTTILTTFIPSFTATHLLPATTFYIKVAAWYADGREGQSPAAAATTLGPPPPPNLKAVTKPRTVSLTWDPAPNASAYRVVRNGQRIVEIRPGTYADGVHLKTGYDDGVDLNTAYNYQVQAVYTYPFLPERIGTAVISTKTPWMFCLPASR